MKYILMCGGDYTQWRTPKQLTQIKGEVILERTIRFLKEAGADDIAISSNDSRFEGFGVPVLHHKNEFSPKAGSWCEAFYPMEEAATYIMGDVYFSPEAIETIVNTQTESIMFFASAPPFSKQYIKPFAEPFAFKVVDQRRFRAAVDFVIANENTGIFRRRPIAWELWQVINGEDVKVINFKNYTVINDYSCDVDCERDKKMLELLK